MVRWRTNGLPPLAQWRDEMDRLMGDFFGALPAARPSAQGTRAFPALNVWEDADHLYAEAELPGLKSEDVDITVVGNELTIKGRRGDAPVEGAAYHRRERGVGEFARTVRLPVEVAADHVSANLRDGVLSITLPKAAAAKPRKINVTVGK